MSQLNEVLGAIDDFRAELLTAQQAISTRMTRSVANLNLRGMLNHNVHPLENVHATGVGIRRKRGKLLDFEFVIKVYVFDKKPGLPKAALGMLAGPFHGVDIDVQELPVMKIRAKAAAKPSSTTSTQHQARSRPVIGGLQIQPRGSRFVGTLGCFVKSVVPGSSDVYVLSNNHVLVETNTLPLGTEIFQSLSDDSADVFAKLSAFEEIQLPTTINPSPTRNRIDAAIAAVTSSSLVQLSTMFGITNYTPTLKAPVPGMKVTKSGRTTGVTQGTIDAIRVNGLRVDYGTWTSPMIGAFDGAIQITGDSGTLFGDSGDSGSAILEQSTGQPVALLFATLGDTTSACDMTAVCTRFNVVPT